MKLILASQSPRRKDLLNKAGLEFDVIPADVDENPDPARSVEDNIKRLASQKAEAVGKNHPEAWVLGADTVVVLDGKIIGKPLDRYDAQRILNELSGKTHQVITGFSLRVPGGKTISETVTSTVSFHPLNENTIEDYIQTGEPMDKAGAYAIQGIGKNLVAGFTGSYSNIVGLPVDEVLVCLKNAGFSI